MLELGNRGIAYDEEPDLVWEVDVLGCAVGR